MQLVQFKTQPGLPSQFGLLIKNNLIQPISHWDKLDELTDNPIELSTATLLPPLPCSPSKIIAVGLNYPAHIDEMKHKVIPDDPVLFLKAPSCIIGHQETILAKPEWGKIDYEGELAVLIGKLCKNASEKTASEFILGYTLANDVTARELQRKDTQWGRAKNFDTFCPIGPFLLLNEGQDPGDFELQTHLEGQLVQSAFVREMRFSVPILIAYISSIMTLYPGDIILTGTPQGVGPLSEGQRVEITINEIGTLENSFKRIPD